MKLVTSITELRKCLADERALARSIGFVPTMGALHQGHISAMTKAGEQCDVVVISIFVNPLQFDSPEDLARYPRPLNNDCQLAQSAGVSYVFAPSEEEMYPSGVFTRVHIAQLTEVLEGAHRPGHFEGMATIVAKLFAIVGKCRAYFGEKDWQQLAVVRRMVKDLSIPVEIVGCPTVRDADGLALSSRNQFLEPSRRAASLALYESLLTGKALILKSETSPAKVMSEMLQILQSQPEVEPDYAVVVNENLQIPDVLDGSERLLVAARVGSVRLIDNMGVEG